MRAALARRRAGGWALAGALALAAAPGAAHAQAASTASTSAAPAPSAPIAPTAPLYERGPADPDGIGKRYLGREISQVMGWQGAAWLERAEREQEERTDLLLPELALRPGMVVADVGAGTGYFSRRLATALGPTGKVYAVDVQPEMVRLLTRLAREPGLGTIQPVLGRVDDVRLPPAAVDLAIMVDVYHELEFPHEVMRSLLKAMKPGGRIVFVEYRGEDIRVPIKALHKMTEAQIRKEAAVHGLAWERTSRVLPWQHIVVFRAP